ncbi:MAG TPA: hypothetical protein VH572_10335 [Gaiella sp.]|jgi:hypothetical protein
MRKLLLLTALATLAWRLWRRSRDAGELERAIVGYEDGSSLVLDPGTPEHERVVAVAREALGR